MPLSFNSRITSAINVQCSFWASSPATPVKFLTKTLKRSPLRFHNPSAIVADERTLEWSMQIGSKQWPEMTTCKSIAATMSLLKQALGIYDQNIASTSITRNHFFATRYCIGIPTSTIPGQVFSGISTRSGDLLSVLVKNLTAMAGEEAQKLHCTLIAEVILELKESGTVLLE